MSSPSLPRDVQRPSPPPSYSPSSSYLDPSSSLHASSLASSPSRSRHSYRSPSSLLPQPISSASTSSQSSFHRLYVKMPPPPRPPYGRTASTSSLSAASTSPLRSTSTLDRFVELASSLKHKATSQESSPVSPVRLAARKSSIPEDGQLPTVHARSELPRRKGWKHSVGDTLWWVVFGTCLVIYVRALAGFGAQDAALWEDRQPAIP